MDEEKHIEQENVKSTAPTSDDRELEIMELEIYRKAWNEINTALADVCALRGNTTVESDPVQLMRNEVAELKKNFSELRQALSDIHKTVSQTQQHNQPQQTMPQFQTMQPTIPLMPYFSTPSYQPVIQLPH